MKEVAKRHLSFKQFLSRFRDEFGQKITPAVLMLSPDAPERFRNVDALASLRDALAMSVVPYAWAHELTSPGQPRALFSDGFNFYPWMVDRQFEDLFARTPAILGVHLVDQFHGQSTPAVPRVQLGPYDIDETLIDALLLAWGRRYGAPRAAWADVALFRSLNMAQQASRAPAGQDATIYDAGRQISLWISAFEILSHPGRGGRSDLAAVLALLDRVTWRSARLRRRQFIVMRDRRGIVRRGALPGKLYRALLDLRNDFLHGDPISRAKLLAPGGRPLWAFAPPLYRMALAAHLDLGRIDAAPLPRDPVELGAAIGARLSSEQRDYERALLTAYARDRAAPIRRSS